MFKWIGIIFTITSVFGCANKNRTKELQPEAQVPQITLEQPAADAEFLVGDTVMISGQFTDPVEIHSYSIQVRNLDGTELIAEIASGHSHRDTIAFQWFWVVRPIVWDTVNVVLRVNNHNAIETELRSRIVIREE